MISLNAFLLLQRIEGYGGAVVNGQQYAVAIYGIAV